MRWSRGLAGSGAWASWPMSSPGLPRRLRWLAFGPGLIVISNSQLYGGMVRIATDARLDDGLLDVAVFAGSGFVSAMRTVLGVITGLHVRDPRHSVFLGREIRVETDKPMAIHLDGEPFGTTPLVCEVVPRALTVMIPRQMRPELFAD